MAIAKVVSVYKSGGSGGGTSSAVDTTGATGIYIGYALYDNPGTVSVSDSKGNTYTALTQSGGVGSYVRLYYCQNPTVGASHTFTVTGTAIFVAFGALAVSGSLTASSFDVESGGTASSTTVQPGSVTPSQDNEILVTAVSFNVINTASINSSFTLDGQLNYSIGVNIGLGLAFKIQTTAGAENPTWTVGSSCALTTRIASFKAAVAGGARQQTLSMLGVGV